MKEIFLDLTLHYEVGLFRRVVSLEIVSHREVYLKPFISSVELLFQCSAEDNRDIR